MIQTTAQSIVTIGIIALMTFLTRAIPFLLFPDENRTPKYIKYLGKVLPYAAIGMLIVYCLKEIPVISYPFGLPEIISIVFVVLIHKWKHNTLYSIGGGTILYMMLVQSVFN